ncbi:transposase [Streptomyces sp. NPDC048211]|uniref:transposase n=1 Tax=Streptomyces sp. NPDC048211 TaxID=3365516 RepID=UPI0037236D99
MSVLSGHAPSRLQLATGCVLQLLLGLSDQPSVEAVRYRIDFMYTMAMELDAPAPTTAC